MNAELAIVFTCFNIRRAISICKPKLLIEKLKTYKNAVKQHSTLFYFVTFWNKEKPDGTTSTTGGVTENHRNIVMNKKFDDKRNRIHEMFHTLFFDNDDAKKGIGSYSRSDMPNQADINMLINNEKLKKVEKKEDEKKK